MPTIGQIDGVKIKMYSANEHNPPHFHASYNGQEVQIDIKQMAVLKGELPPRQLHQVIEWAKPIWLFSNSTIRCCAMADKIHHVLEILGVEPFKITCKWDTGEVRVNDLETRFREWERHPHLHPLLDYKIFRDVTVGEDGTLQWPSVPVTVTFLGKTITAPLDLDPIVLYETSKPLSAYRLVPVEQAA